MKKTALCSVVFLIFAAVSYAQTSQETLSRQEKQGWDAFKSKDAKSLLALLSKDFVDIRQDGTVLSRSGVVQAMYEYEIAEISTTDFKVIPVDADAAVLMYRMSVKANYKGQTLPDLHLQASTLYVQSNGRWMARMHQETPIASAPASQTQTQTAPTRP